MQSLEEYIKSNILKFRKSYAMLDQKIKEALEKREDLYSIRLNKPVQVVVITFTKSNNVFFIFANSGKFPDMKTIGYPNMVFKKFWDNDEIEEILLDLFGQKGVDIIRRELKPFSFSVSPTVSSMAWNESTLFVHLGNDPRTTKFSIAEDFFSDVEFEIRNIEREDQSKKIETTVDTLKRDVEAIPEKFEFKTQILETTARLDVEIKELHRRVDEEIGAFREIVGKSEKFQDWKMFSGDMKFLKKTHVTKETFRSEIKRLEDTINARIDSIGDIKEAYDKVLSQQSKFMEQQAEVMKQQSSFISWIKYATIVVPVAVVSVPIIEIVLRYFLGIS